MSEHAELLEDLADLGSDYSAAREAVALIKSLQSRLDEVTKQRAAALDRVLEVAAERDEALERDRKGDEIIRGLTIERDKLEVLAAERLVELQEHGRRLDKYEKNAAGDVKQWILDECALRAELEETTAMLDNAQRIAHERGCRLDAYRTRSIRSDNRGSWCRLCDGSWSRTRGAEWHEDSCPNFAAPSAPSEGAPPPASDTPAICQDYEAGSWCVRERNHQGAHKDAFGSQWSWRVTPAPSEDVVHRAWREHIASQCGATALNRDMTLYCAKPAKHDGPHAHGGWTWNDALAPSEGEKPK